MQKISKEEPIFNKITLTSSPLTNETYSKPTGTDEHGNKIYKEEKFTPLTKLERMASILLQHSFVTIIEDKKLERGFDNLIKKEKVPLILEQIHNYITTYEDVYKKLFINKATVGNSYKYLNFDINMLRDQLSKKIYKILEREHEKKAFPISDKVIIEIRDLILNEGYRPFIEEELIPALKIREEKIMFQKNHFACLNQQKKKLETKQNNNLNSI